MVDDSAVTISDMFDRDKSACVDRYEFVDVVSQWFDSQSQNEVHSLGLLVASSTFNDQTEDVASRLGVIVEQGTVRCTLSRSNEPVPWSNTCSSETRYLDRIDVTAPSGEKVAEIFVSPDATDEQRDDLLLDHDFRFFLWT